MSLAALAFLHHDLRLATAAMAVLVAGLVTLAVRRSWADLPGFVTSWLDGGVFVVGMLVVVATTALTAGVPYAVLRVQETLALLGTAAMLGTAVGGLAYTHRRLELEVRAAAEHLADARRRALESRLAALSAQINPHFLFNTLNTLAEVVHEDEDQAEDLVSDLAQMMRYALDSSSTRVSLAQEFDIVRRLLRIESARLGERLVFELDLDPAVAEARLPGLLVQPLVENAVQHGVARRVEGGRVRVTATQVDGAVRVEVEDDGTGLAPEVLASLDAPLGDDIHPGGLRNVVERVRLAWPEGSASFVCDTGSPHTRILLTFPLETR
ncbi:MAG: histidine kinase [Myxococcota bacterium]